MDTFRLQDKLGQSKTPFRRLSVPPNLSRGLRATLLGIAKQAIDVGHTSDIGSHVLQEKRLSVIKKRKEDAASSENVFQPASSLVPLNAIHSDISRLSPGRCLSMSSTPERRSFLPYQRIGVK